MSHIHRLKKYSQNLICVSWVSRRYWKFYLFWMEVKSVVAYPLFSYLSPHWKNNFYHTEHIVALCACDVNEYFGYLFCVYTNIHVCVSKQATVWWFVIYKSELRLYRKKKASGVLLFRTLRKSHLSFYSNFVMCDWKLSWQLQVMQSPWVNSSVNIKLICEVWETQ